MDEEIINRGVYDRVIPEVICRLVDSGERCVDVGANVGQNTSMMAVASGREGKVWAVEPHPEVHAMLARSAASWRDYDLAPIELVKKGLGERRGAASLFENERFPGNQGLGTVIRPAVVLREHGIEMTTLDEMLAGVGGGIGLLKIDVEGHEAAVLRGAAQNLREGAFRDILFEDLGPQPGESARLLEEAGYTVVVMVTWLIGPRMHPLQRYVDGKVRGYFSFNYLATKDPDRATSRMRWPGWRCMEVRARPFLNRRRSFPLDGLHQPVAQPGRHQAAAKNPADGIGEV